MADQKIIVTVQFIVMIIILATVQVHIALGDCGDGAYEPWAGEQCDDGNSDDLDFCSYPGCKRKLIDCDLNWIWCCLVPGFPFPTDPLFPHSPNHPSYNCSETPCLPP